MRKWLIYTSQQSICRSYVSMLCNLTCYCRMHFATYGETVATGFWHTSIYLYYKRTKGPVSARTDENVLRRPSSAHGPPGPSSCPRPVTSLTRPHPAVPMPSSRWGDRRQPAPPCLPRVWSSCSPPAAAPACPFKRWLCLASATLCSPSPIEDARLVLLPVFSADRRATSTSTIPP